ncbi:MAG: hypothetical protein COV09_00105 [Candidatus Vogelbacteria bacterium CG10_big_fil_rev_8_21_14_0_10_50_13]|uniref:Septum formation initiator n=1 Tax=Candidatus Vogelbacteria bacterium CG10_big_fil_rev_8_21_14_0_10_50_13 TaxID=1975044 RepID=A0A2H0RI17_9BACT|nr:MAG: hypothetical protein COV09_00105 [Candidatus Vogelbacteria bacterium CG10_big_fil_rev_8_21_14_0_10_50_13]
MAVRQDGRRAANKETGWGRRLLAVGIFILIVALARSVWLVQGKFIESRTARDEAAAAATALETRKIGLERKVERLDTVRGQEEEIRQKLPVAKEGEQVVVIIDESADNDDAPGETKSWWQNLWPF